MWEVAKIVFTELVIVAIGVVSIAEFYIFVSPHCSSYFPLIIGLALVAIASGYIARKLLVKKRKVGWTAVAIISAAATILTLNLALFWTVNARGS